jgi:2'-5' RNA ligase
MAYGVLAYPVLKEDDYQVIQAFRSNHDKLYFSVAEPHFAFVFPVERIGKEQFINEIRNRVEGSVSFNFQIKCATINKDAFLDYYHLLLVPDAGYSDVVKLHDRLYGGLLSYDLRLDIDFIPHIGIANSKDKYQVKQWVDHLNSRPLLMEGTVKSITIIDYTDGVLTDLETIHLKQSI